MYAHYVTYDITTPSDAVAVRQQAAERAAELRLIMVFPEGNMARLDGEGWTSETKRYVFHPAVWREAT